MAIPFRDRISMWLPPSLYYERRVAEEIGAGEPELAALRDWLPRKGTAVDGGANYGIFAYALSKVACRVVAFEPNPDCARFARRMLRGRAEVHELALSDRSGRATFYLPYSDEGVALHYAGNLKRSHSQFKDMRTYEVEVRTLDSFSLQDVTFIKADVEGSEREVLDGARQTIARDRPILLLELLSGTHDDPGGYAGAICDSFGYEAFIFQRGEKLPALPVIKALGKNSSWGTEIETRNVLFLPN